MTPVIEERKDIVLDCRGVSKNFGAVNILFDVSLRVIRGETIGIVGPSGCGKSTLLKMILGTIAPSKGEIVVFSKNGTPHKVEKPGRDRGIVYQNYSLFPFLTAAENVAFGLVLDGTSLPFRFFRPWTFRQLKRQYLRQAEEWLDRLGLAKAINKYPRELSGGMCQRVAIAQALIIKPRVLLLDEPFGALDEATREALQRMLLVLYEENYTAKKTGQIPPHTILIVTHEINEAIFVSDRVIGLSQNWDWKFEGHEAFPGATIVYDKAAPVFHPDDVRDFEQFKTQRDEILNNVMEPKRLQNRQKWQTFWQQVKEGNGHGVLQNGLSQKHQ
jgi:NitT/TauT family transport system ATP-binding protein